MNQTVLTSQGTITIPVHMRRKYGLSTGDVLTIEDDDGIRISKNTSLEDVRKKNRAHLKHAPRTYKQGDGFTLHVIEKYGKR